MATLNEIDTKAFIGKYVSRQTTGVRINADSDTAEENQGVLESIAISLLLNPQAVLSIILRAKNSLQQLITAELDIINYIIDAISETQNPDEAVQSTADIVDAQTALVELDRIGRIDTNLQAFVRYDKAVKNFLDHQLGPLLKRTPNNSFNRSGLEAKQDLFNSVGLFTQTHLLMNARLKTLAKAVIDYNSVDLSKVVHTQTIARVRTSLTQIKAGMDGASMSNTVAALELMSGSAALQSISNSRKLYDPTIQSSVFPVGNTLEIGPEPTAAFAESNPGPLLATATMPWEISLDTDGAGVVTAELPRATLSGAPFLVNSIPTGPYNIPVGYHLYVEVTPGSAPVNGSTLYDITLTSGLRTHAQILADINAAFGVSGPTASDFDNPIGYIILAGDNIDDSIRVLDTGPGTFTPPTFTPSNPSAHEILGFAPNQVSTTVGTFDFNFLQLFFQAMFPLVSTELVEVENGPLLVRSNNTTPLTSSLLFSGTTAADFGFPTSIVPAVPLAMLLTDTTGTTQDPVLFGLLPGSVVHAQAFIQPIQGFDGNRILFAVPLPLERSPLTAFAPSVVAVQGTTTVLGLFNGTFDNDILPLQGLLSPLLTTPSLAQVNDATRAFVAIEVRLTNLLSGLASIVVSESQQPAEVTAESVLKTLEERGFDHALDLMAQCRFTEFFALTAETVSKSTRFMKTMETVVTADLATSTVEEDIPDGNIVAAVNPTTILTNKEVP